MVSRALKAVITAVTSLIAVSLLALCFMYAEALRNTLSAYLRSVNGTWIGSIAASAIETCFNLISFTLLLLGIAVVASISLALLEDP